jgi:hypothetical protein
MKSLVVLWFPVYTLIQLLLRSFHTDAQLNPYCDLVCRDFEVGYLPPETLSEISLLCYRKNTHEI